VKSLVVLAQLCLSQRSFTGNSKTANLNHYL